MIYRLVTAMTRRQKRGVFAAMDALVAAASVLLAVVLSASLRGEPAALAPAMPLALCVAFSAIVLTWSLGLPQVKLNAFEIRSAARAAVLALFVTVAGMGLDEILGTGFAIGQHVIAGLILLVLTVSWRFLLLTLTKQIYRRGKPRMRVLIYGAGQTGRQLAAALRHDQNVYPVAFLDDNPTLQSLVVGGLRVHAPSAVEGLVRTRRIDRIVLAMPSISTPALSRIAHGLRNVGPEVHALPSFAQMVGQAGVPLRAAPVPLDSLLGRSQLGADLPSVGDAYTGRRIMVTGAGGSIGSELCRQILSCDPQCLVLVDQSELALYTIDKELAELGATPEIVPVLGSVLDGPAMAEAMLRHRVDVVLHAAAYKHLPLVEMNPIAGLENNVGHPRAGRGRARGQRRPLHPGFVRQGRPAGQRHGRVQAPGRAGGTGPCHPLGAHAVLDGALRQRAGIQRFGHSAVRGADRARRPGDADPFRGHALLHDDRRGRAPGASGGVLRARRRRVRAGHGRRRADPQAGAPDDRGGGGTRSATPTTPMATSRSASPACARARSCTKSCLSCPTC